MFQQVLARPHWSQELSARDPIALTPLICEHMTSYGRIDLEMNFRRQLD
jgi:hypothetical protein